ncbi:hypothetical protein [Pseudomonas palleroniana]|uniref:hypothetical protein n=1 Tax=Pseudomonas palleroniana TaxID=191390 RepID=UPI0018E6AAF9|nr:hypothetical protein [Pseudomonas palleroniana]MBI6908233.1 hypothetical protein [Pseudomonas palleroniana]UOP10468.1 hypothetical protein LDL65_25870 [Pseudomonas palleroniana]
MSSVNQPTAFPGANHLIESIIATLQNKPPVENRPLSEDQQRVLNGLPVQPQPTQVTY